MVVAYLGFYLGLVLILTTTVLNLFLVKRYVDQSYRFRNFISILIPILWLLLMYLTHQEFILMLLCFLPQLIFQILLAVMTFLNLE
jgi:hypothetical protein